MVPKTSGGYVATTGIIPIQSLSSDSCQLPCIVWDMGNFSEDGSLHLISGPGFLKYQFSSVQLLSPVWLFATLWFAGSQGLPVHHQLPEFTQTHVHWVGDAIQPSHPLSSPSPPAPNSSQHQDLFQWVNSSHEAAKVLKFQLQHQSLQWTPRTDLLQDGLVGSPCSPRDSQ